jgi:hypothetical protein
MGLKQRAKGNPMSNPEPLHRRTLAPLIQARIEEIRVENVQMKAEILAKPEAEWTWLERLRLRYIEAREESELMAEMFRLIREKPMNKSAVDDAMTRWLEHLETQRSSRE